MWQTNGTDIVELTRSLREAVGDSVAAQWFLHLRDVCGRALMVQAHTSNAIVWRGDHQRRGDLEEKADTDVLLRQLGSEGVKGRRVDVVATLASMDRELIDLSNVAWNAADEGDDAYQDGVRRRLEGAIRRATESLAGWLGISPEPRRTWRWQGQGPLASVSERTRGPDIEPRKPRAAAPRAQKPTKEQKAAARATARMTRVVLLLRRQPDGLSAKGIKTALKMGDDETRAAIRAAMDADTIVLRGSLEKSKYYASPRLPEKGTGKRSQE